MGISTMGDVVLVVEVLEVAVSVRGWMSVIFVGGHMTCACDCRKRSRNVEI